MGSDRSSDKAVLRSGNDDPWRLRLFFSVDLIGSTAYKAYAKNALDDSEWCWTFEEFYANFPEILEQSRLAVEDWVVCGEESYAVPWKFLGDEILFHLELRDYRETLFHLCSLQLAIQKYNKKLRDKFLKSKGNVVLQCKGTAWLAGFPISNIEIKLPSGRCDKRPDSESQENSSEIAEKYVDFIGSQMDCGFRLTKYASTRKLVMSVDLALMIAAAMEDVSSRGHKSGRDEKMAIRFDGRESLKGVLAGKPYPVFWLDQECEKLNLEDKWLSLGEKCEPGEVVEYCKNFLEATESIHVPFIDNDKGERFFQKPDGFEERRKEAIEKRNQLRIDMPLPGSEGVSGEENIDRTNELKGPDDSVIE